MKSLRDLMNFHSAATASRGLSAIVPIFLLACGNASGSIKEVTWTEQVEISPGEHVFVERRVRFSVSRTWGEQTAGIDRILESKIEVRSVSSDIPSFDAKRMLPLLLRRDPINRELLLIVTTNDCLVWARNGKPEPAYWAFRLHAEKWYRTELPPSIVGSGSNLLTDVRATDKGKLADEQVANRKRSASETSGRFAAIKSDGEIEHCGSIGTSTAKGDFWDLEKR